LDVDVVFVKGCNGPGFFDAEENLIIICADIPPNEIEATILHEAGHAYLLESPEMHMALFPKRYWYDYHYEYLIEYLSEEVAAWQKGLEIAREINYTVDKTQYILLATRCLNKYWLWAVEDAETHGTETDVEKIIDAKYLIEIIKGENNV
jgi:hypothetical protein